MAAFLPQDGHVAAERQQDRGHGEISGHEIVVDPLQMQLLAPLGGRRSGSTVARHSSALPPGGTTWPPASRTGAGWPPVSVVATGKPSIRASPATFEWPSVREWTATASAAFIKSAGRGSQPSARTRGGSGAPNSRST